MIDRLNRAGTETQLLALIRGLDRSRVRPYLCLLDGTDELSHLLEPTDCPVLHLGLSAIFRTRSVSAAARLASFWRRHRIDVVQTYFLDSTYFSVPLARACGISRIVRVRNNLGYWVTGVHRWLGRCMGVLTDRTLTNSDAGRDALVQIDRVHPWKVAVVENGVDLARFEGHPPPDTGAATVGIGAVGNLRPVKNMDGLVRVAAALAAKRPGLRFEIAGDGPQRPELESLIAGRNLGHCVRLAGSVTDIPSFLARHDVAVLPSHSEGMSNALLEYMASGRAIVATDVGANARLVEHGRHGLIVPPRDDAALAGAIERLLTDPALAVRLGAEARQRAEQAFGRAAMCRRFEAFYLALCGRDADRAESARAA